MSPSTTSSAKLPALPRGIQQLICHYTNLKIKDMAARGIITVNQSLYKATRSPTVTVQPEQTFMPR